MILVNADNDNQGKLLIPRLLGANMAVRACVRAEASAKLLKREMGMDLIDASRAAGVGIERRHSAW